LEETVTLRKLVTVVIEQSARVPVTLAVALLAVVIACIPSAADLLQFDRVRIASGEIWRMATGHLTHWNMDHIQWDLLMFVAVGAICELRDPRRMRLCVMAAAASVSMLVFSAFPSVDAYRGLSGIDTALFTLLAIDLMRDAVRYKSGMLALVAGGLLFGFVAKTGFEAVTGHAYFVNQDAAGFDLLIWDHVAAAVVGALVGFPWSNLPIRLNLMHDGSHGENSRRHGANIGRGRAAGC
jgi:rhomboid family GlyGly-CTERM serine protease